MTLSEEVPPNSIPKNELLNLGSQVFRPIQYLGNKLRVLHEIVGASEQLVDSGERIADLFTGTTVVAQALARRGHTVHAVDAQLYPQVFANALLGIGRLQNESLSPNRITRIELSKNIECALGKWSKFVEQEEDAVKDRDATALRALYAELPLIWRNPSHPTYQCITESSEDFVWDGPLLTCLFAGRYFGLRQALELDRLRHKIQILYSSRRITEWQFNVALTAVMHAASLAVHSAGKHFEVDPGFGTRVLVGKPAVSLLDGADHDEENETEDCRRAEGEDRP